MSEHAPGRGLQPSAGQVEYLFPTPLFWQTLGNAGGLNAELAALILERERTTPSVAKSNQGGWQSAPDLLEWGGAAVAALKDFMAQAVQLATARLPVLPQTRFEFELFAWAAVNRRGHYNSTHVHPLSTWSGCYYVDPGDEPPGAAGACLEFTHPIAAAVMSFFPGTLPSARLIRPEAGLLVLFPSYLQHGVRMYRGERPRICVAFNAHLWGAQRGVVGKSLSLQGGVGGVSQSTALRRRSGGAKRRLPGQDGDGSQSAPNPSPPQPS